MKVQLEPLARKPVQHTPPSPFNLHVPSQWSPRSLVRQLLGARPLVVLTIGVVYWSVLVIPALAASPASRHQAQASPTNATLPRATAEMRDAILGAVHSGQLADLKTALDLNEMRPDISDDPVDDPIAHLRALSKDGEGREILDVLGKILEARPANVPLGRDIENNAIFVWPYLAERTLKSLTADEIAELKLLTGAETASAITASGRWTWWRVAIGADGTWHSFRREK
jgi:hypothetical protein